MKPTNLTTLSTILILCIALAGCSTRSENSQDDAVPQGDAAATSQTQLDDANTDASSNDPATTSDAESLTLGSYEIDPQALLAAQLTPEQLEQGWVRLFDGQSLFGWFMFGQANWRVEEGIIRVDRGEKSFLCTSFPISDFELQLEFRADAQTNSGIFLRATPQPQDVAVDCLELNIAPPSNPFPTGSFVQRKKLEPEELGEFDPTAWHTYHIRVAGQQVEVSLDDKKVMQLDDFTAAPTGHISLQHNEGRVEFRNILLRPVDATALKLDESWEDDWRLSEKEEGTFTAEVVDDGLKLSGGLGQLQSKNSYGDFFLRARYTLARPEVNSGIFFRCIADAMLDGYECQVNHAVENGDPLRPADAGAGAIFRRQPARIVVGDGTQPTHIALLASGKQIVTWVNGIQVVDFYDAREPDENPRRGARTAPGPVAIQGHDPSTEVVFHELSIAEL